MKKILMLAGCLCLAAAVFAQSDDSLFDDDLFGGDDDFFFEDSGIEEVTEVKAKTDLSKGVLFEDGTIKIGGTFNTSISTSTVLYEDSDESFGDHIADTTLTPSLNTFLSFDARPTQNLRMYTKFGLAYPFTTKATSNFVYDFTSFPPSVSGVNTTITEWFKLKELFTDFSIADTAFFRFGLHTVTWGTGYFFSPVSDMINTTSIDPEDTDAQVDGSLNLRTQITFPDTQNCLWFYVIPSTDFANAVSTETYIKDTAFAGKFDLLLGSWELGLGGFYKYSNAPKAMLTASGSLKKVSFFGEFVYQYGSASDWLEDSSWSHKTSIFMATAGFSYIWKTPSIVLAAQYYYDGNDEDIAHAYVTHGHNVAFVTNFGRVFGTTDVTATVFGLVNFGKDDIPELFLPYLQEYGILDYLNTATFSAMLNYKPVSAMTIGMGPYMTFAKWTQAPVVSLKLNFTLGGGKF